jgi:hypothetical protein
LTARRRPRFRDRSAFLHITRRRPPVQGTKEMPRRAVRRSTLPRRRRRGPRRGRAPTACGRVDGWRGSFRLPTNRYSSNRPRQRSRRSALGRAGSDQLRLNGDDVGDQTEPRPGREVEAGLGPRCASPCGSPEIRLARYRLGLEATQHPLIQRIAARLAVTRPIARWRLIPTLRRRYAKAAAHSYRKRCVSRASDRGSR